MKLITASFFMSLLVATAGAVQAESTAAPSLAISCAEQAQQAELSSQEEIDVFMSGCLENSQSDAAALELSEEDEAAENTDDEASASEE